MIQGKKFLTRKSWFKFLDVTESKRQWTKVAHLLGSVNTYDCNTHIFTTYRRRSYIHTIDRFNHIYHHLPIPFIWCGKPTHMERTTDSLLFFVRSCSIFIIFVIVDCVLLFIFPPISSNQASKYFVAQKCFISHEDNCSFENCRDARFETRSNSYHD